MDVLYMVDASGSMRGSQWNKAVNEVRQMIQVLPNGSTVGAVAFGQNIKTHQIW